jgi:hypothetical protein
MQLEEEECPWCGVAGVIKPEPEPRVVIAPPTIQRIVTPNFDVVARALTAAQWVGIRDELVKASQALAEKRYSDGCNNLRTALLALWSKVAERLSGKAITLDKSGKTVDIAPLIKVLKDEGVPDDVVGVISRTWSLLSERVHIEKRGGVQPPECETIYGLQLTMAALEYLLRIMRKRTPKRSP